MADRGIRVLPLSRGIRVQSHFPELTTTREYVDHGSATMIVLLDAKSVSECTSRFVRVAQHENSK